MVLRTINGTIYSGEAMLKITNQFGDVKIGRQGEVVYQRKYGEQIRRTVSPKSAIASQRQIDHRQLYRDALTWRSQLSLANRRYLDGYCISNRVVDRYHIPLPWSRFALKIYLQSVKFAVIDKPTDTLQEYEGVFENYQVYTGSASFRTSHWMGMTFTPLISHTLTEIGLRVRRADVASGNFIVSIRNTDGNGHPTGEDLSSKTVLAESLPTDAAPPETIFTLDTEIPAPIDTKLAIVMRAPTMPSGKYVSCLRDTVTPTYPRGNLEDSVNSGGTWDGYDQDFWFKEYGYYTYGEKTPGLIHARHPALLKVVHLRGELAVNGYDNLSSLDEEYLTCQVGLDVEVGDILKATTLPGIEYTYPVS